MASADRRALIALLLLCGTIISICMGMRQSLGLFMRPMTIDAGVSAATFGFAIALQNMVWGLSQPFVGALADRYGSRPVLIGTALCFAAGLALMSVSRGALLLDVAGFLLGIGTAGTSFGVLMGLVTRASPLERRSQNVGIVAAAGSLGTMVLAPVGQSLIDGYGWQAALVTFACIASSMILFALPIRGLAVRLRAEHAGPMARRTPLREALREALRHRGYLFMTLAYFACGFQLVFLTTHLPAYLQLCGVAPGVGATALGLIGLFNAIGTYCFGLLGALQPEAPARADLPVPHALHHRVPVRADQHCHHAGLRVRDGHAVAGGLAPGHRDRRPGVRPGAFRHALWRGLPQPPVRLLLRRLDGRAGVRLEGQLRLRLGRLDRHRLHRVHAAVDDGRSSTVANPPGRRCDAGGGLTLAWATD